MVVLGLCLVVIGGAFEGGRPGTAVVVVAIWVVALAVGTVAALVAIARGERPAWIGPVALSVNALTLIVILSQIRL